MDWLTRVFGVESGYELAWIGIGLAGQAMFMVRFIVQWIVSERARRSVIPVSFWWFSVGGAAILLLYAIHRLDPVFILGQLLGFVVYFRNIWLVRAERRRRRSRHGPGDSG
jgi:lipid-A-disaccharide synthase-like uncharacterized protein